MRLFVAVNLPEETRTALDHALEPMRTQDLDVRWTAPESVHLTLQFLGGVSEARVPAVREALEQMATRHATFEVEIREFGAFPSPRRARIWWVGIGPVEPLLTLQRDVERVLEPLGFEPEKRAYHPHLTVARAKGAPRATPEEVVRGFDFRQRFAVRSVDLMQSRLLRSGARYEAIGVCPLAHAGSIS